MEPKRILQAAFATAVLVALIALAMEPSFASGAALAGAVAALVGTFFVGSSEELEVKGLFSKQAKKAVFDKAREIIPDDSKRQIWNEFDVRFLSDCVKDTHRGIAVDGYAAQNYLHPQNDALFGFAVQIYGEVCGELGEEHSDYLTLNRIMQMYFEGRMEIRRRYTETGEA